MKRAKIIVRENIIGIANDTSLRALNGYYESPFMDFPDDTDRMTAAAVLENKYKEHFAKMRIDTIEVVWEDTMHG